MSNEQGSNIFTRTSVKGAGGACKKINEIRRLKKDGGRYRVRTCGPYHVKVVLYR